MAIISAGVIMNVIFAFLMAIVAFRFGVREWVGGVGSLSPGEGAWASGLKVGDRVREINGRQVNTFQDLLEAIALGDVQDGVTLVVSRSGVSEPLTFHMETFQIAGRPRIGVGPPQIPTLWEKDCGVQPGSVASKCTPAFEPGDVVVRIDDQPIENFAQLTKYFALHADKPLEITVKRKPKAAEGDTDASPAEPEQLTIRVAPNPMHNSVWRWRWARSPRSNRARRPRPPASSEAT